MNSPIKTLSALVIGGFLAGTAVAGPGDAYGAGFASRALFTNSKSVSIGLFHAKRHVSSDARAAASSSKNIVSVPNVNPKVAGGIPTATGYKH